MNRVAVFIAIVAAFLLGNYSGYRDGKKRPEPFMVNLGGTPNRIIKVGWDSDDCPGCPVSESGHPMCHDTPYMAAHDAFCILDVIRSCDGYADVREKIEFQKIEFEHYAQLEIDFLKNLRQKYAQ